MNKSSYWAAGASLLLMSACNTVEGVGEDMQSVAVALDPNASYAPCGTYGAIDRDNNGVLTRAEWDDYRVGAFAGWDTNRDGRIDQREFGSCWYGGGFYTAYDRNAWPAFWKGFDLNRDGYIGPHEYYSSAAWYRLDINKDGQLSPTEWVWR